MAAAYANVPSFLLKTYDIVSDKKLDHIISWNKEGNSFIVHLPNDFSTEVLPLHFKTSRFSSFVRQLNMYEFRKIRDNSNEHEFVH